MWWVCVFNLVFVRYLICVKLWIWECYMKWLKKWIIIKLGDNLMLYLEINEDLKNCVVKFSGDIMVLRG